MHSLQPQTLSGCWESNSTRSGLQGNLNIPEILREVLNSLKLLDFLETHSFHLGNFGLCYSQKLIPCSTPKKPQVHSAGSCPTGKKGKGRGGCSFYQSLVSSSCRTSGVTARWYSNLHSLALSRSVSSALHCLLISLCCWTSPSYVHAQKNADQTPNKMDGQLPSLCLGIRGNTLLPSQKVKRGTIMLMLTPTFLLIHILFPSKGNSVRKPAVLKTRGHGAGEEGSFAQQAPCIFCSQTHKPGQG